MLEFFVVGIGGFIGSCMRFAFTKATSGMSGVFPFGTLLSNVLAGLLIGFFIGLEQQSVTFSTKTKLFITTGLLGGLSTFSTFSLETILLFESGKYFSAAGNIGLNLALSLLGVVCGIVLAKLMVKKA
ncbi:putative fluoride ion transporter CrcB [Clostridia bacterium]|nr:putative fluoride ion transporter CrcB [Clostridia bacterium]